MRYLLKKVGRGKVHLTLEGRKRYLCGLQISGQFDICIESANYLTLYQLRNRKQLCKRCLDRIVPGDIEPKVERQVTI